MFGALSHLHSALRIHPSPAKNVLVLNGHPDPGPAQYCATLCAAYAEGARSSGHRIRRFDLGTVITPEAESGHLSWLRDTEAEVLERLWLADRIFVAFPMRRDGLPPTLRLILEKFARWQETEEAQLGEPTDVKDAHIVVTTSFPALIYRTSHGTILGDWTTSLPGLRIARVIVIGSLETISREDRSGWLNDMHRLGALRL